MSGRLFPSPFHRVSLFSLSLLLLSTITTNGNPLCRPTDCGEIHGIHYPFWVVHDPPATMPFSSCCGYQELKITCKGGTPMLSLSGDNYTVTFIEYKTKTIHLTDSDVLGAHGRPWSLHNLTLGPDSLLNYTSEDTTLTFYFNCTNGPLDFGFEGDGGSQSYVFISDQVPKGYDWGSICGEVVVVPVLNVDLQEILSVGHKLTAFLDHVLQKGFRLQWGSDDCAACEKLGDRCRCNITSGSSRPFICIPGDDGGRQQEIGMLSHIFVIAAVLIIYSLSVKCG